MSVYPLSFLKNHDVIEERYSTKNNPNAKKERDSDWERSERHCKG